MLNVFILFRWCDLHMRLLHSTIAVQWLQCRKIEKFVDNLWIVRQKIDHYGQNTINLCNRHKILWWLKKMLCWHEIRSTALFPLLLIEYSQIIHCHVKHLFWNDKSSIFYQYFQSSSGFLVWESRFGNCGMNLGENLVLKKNGSPGRFGLLSALYCKLTMNWA